MKVIALFVAALSIAGCRGKIDEGAEPMTDAAPAADAASGAPCVFSDGKCIGDCICQPAQGYWIYEPRGCHGPSGIIACQTPRPGAPSCPASAAVTCLQRRLPDGGREILIMPYGYAHWDAGGLESCGLDESMMKYPPCP